MPGALVSTETASVLFTDLVASTELRQSLGEERADAFRRTHDDLLTDAVTAAGGTVVKGLGDGIMAVFSSAADAVVAAIAIQRAASAHGRPHPDEAFQVRIGISVGDVSVEDGDYFGTAVVEAARLCEAAQGEQILVADLVRALARGRGGITFESMGELDLKGLDAPVPTCWVNWEPPSTADAARVPFPTLLAPTTAGTYTGRLGLLADLSKAWDLASGGEGARLVLLSGEPGIGKTRTSSELARRAHEDGAVVLYGRCDEELALPYEPFVEALDHQTAHDPSLPLGRFPGDLRRLVPDIGERVRGLPEAIRSDPRAEEHRLFEATASWLTALASEHGVVLVVDDLHWATRPTLQMLLHVQRVVGSSPDARCLVIGTYRDTDIDRAHPLFDLLGDLRRMPNVERLSIDPLSEGEVMELIEDVAGHELDEPIRQLARRAHAETEGNPYFVSEVLRHFVESGVVKFDEGRWTVENPDHVDVPEGVRDVVGRRLNRLSDGANKVLTAASVIGRDFSLDVVASAADVDPDRVLDVLDEAIRARLVDEVGVDRFRFAHALTRQTLYEELSASRRRRLHRSVVAALEQHQPTDLSNLAHHSIEAGPVGGDLSGAIDYSIRAGQQSLDARATDDARGHFEAALEMLEEAVDAHPALALQARLGLGVAQRDASDSAFRETLLTVTHDALGQGLHAIATQAAMANGRGIESMIGAVDEGRVDALEQVLDNWAGDDRDRALLLARLAGEIGQRPGLVEKRLSLLDEARALARAEDDPLLLAQVLTVTMNASNVPERFEELLAAADELMDAADTAGDPTLRVMARIHRAYAFHSFGRFTESRALFEEAAAIAHSEASPSAQWIADNFCIQHSAWDGDLDACRAAAQQLLERGLELGEPDATNWFGGLTVGMLWATGELGSAADMLWSIAEQWPEVTGYKITAAAAEHERGNVEVARQRVLAEGLADGPNLSRDLFAVALWNIQAELCFRMDLPAEAEALLGVVEPFRDNWGTNGIWVYLPAHITIAACHATIGNMAAAHEHARLGWDALLASPARCNIPTAAVTVAQILIRVGSVDALADAQTVVERGLAEAEAFGIRTDFLSELADELGSA